MLNKAVINLKTLTDNALAVKKKLSRGVKFCAVVKADAYGHGAERVASALYNIVDSYAVAILEEGISLRLSAIDKDILCLTPVEKESLSRAVLYQITLTVTSKIQVDNLEMVAKKLKKSVKVHIKYNTGMNRQGVDGLDNLRELIEHTVKKKWVKLDGLYSHLYAPENKNALKKQLNKFLLANNLIKGYNNKVTCHVSASGGLISGVQADMVRVGILLYGYKPFESDFIKVSPVMKVYAPVIENRVLNKGEVALYGKKRADKRVEISLIRYGYADGLFRREIDGQFNNRCMDLTAVTKSEHTTFGYPVMQDADDLARRYGTISYEILVKSALRAERIYID